MRINNTCDWWSALDSEIKEITDIVYCYNRENGKQFIDAVKDRDSEVVWSILQTAWGNAPDSPHIHEIAGWGTFCDLCSEYWVFDDGE